MNPLQFQLNDEQRNRIADCLRKEGLRLAPEAELAFINNLGHSIRTFLRERSTPDSTTSETHEALRGVYQLAHEEDCPVGQLRARIQNLPQLAKDYLERRAPFVIPALYPKTRFKKRFQNWARSASRDRLVRVVAVLSAEGAQLVARSRGNGKRSKPRPEPVILGHAKGAGGGSRKGGRPRHVLQSELIMWLAVDWLVATGQAPRPGRSDHEGFGDLVHGVFQWLKEPGADQALRRYWDEVKAGQIRAAEREVKRKAPQLAPGFRQQD